VFGRRQLERQVAELAAILGTPDTPIIASGAVMTLPAAAADLKVWVADDRDFQSLQGDDWLHVIEDLRQSLATSGPKLRRVVEAIATPIEPLLQKLISSTPGPDGAPIFAIDSVVRAELLPRLEQLDAELATEAAIRAAWRDLVSTSEDENVHRQVEELNFRRDTLWAIARRRGVDLGEFGVFWDVTAVLTDNPDAVQRELDLAAGVVHQLVPLSEEPTGQAAWQRIKLCEEILARPVRRADCIVWLRLAPTSLPQREVTHGQVTFYNADYLSSFIGRPHLADRFQVPPIEVLDPQGDPPFLRAGEVEWEHDWHMVYARVEVRDTEVHAAVAKARTLVEALKAVHHATKGTWRILNGSILFVDGKRVSGSSWGPKADVDIPDHFEPRNDWMGQDIERMLVRDQALDSESVADLQEAITLSAALKEAASPQDTVMAAVRALEHVNVRATGGGHWADFSVVYFKKAQARVKVTEFIHGYARAAVEFFSPALPPSDPLHRELADIQTSLSVFQWPHQLFNTRAAADHIPALKRIYADHCLVRGLGELETVLATPAGMYARLEEQCRRFDRQIGRVKRLRNSSLHGGPVSEAACESVAAFARNLGLQSINEAMRALLTGRDIPSHMTDYRTDHQERYEKVRTAGDVDALFVEWR
jgi:hypothetical protein